LSLDDAIVEHPMEDHVSPWIIIKEDLIKWDRSTLMVVENLAHPSKSELDLMIQIGKFGLTLAHTSIHGLNDSLESHKVLRCK